MFIDELKLHLKAGNGGDGVVRWRHEKGKEFSGPSGGNGGKGGDVYVVGVKDLGRLIKYRDTKFLKARDGKAGMKDGKQGERGESLIVELPVGSRIKNLSNGFVFELLEDGQKLRILEGGRGGLGNEFFKSSVNVSPKETNSREEGEEADFFIELLLIVDFALIGMPNAGKSSLLNALTGAKSKVGDFSFTTLEPNLGILHGLVIADIPGLIEGASKGRGLGIKFLRHIERTKALLHLVSCEESEPEKAYGIVREELEDYNKAILNKPEIILLTKADLVSKEVLEDKIGRLQKMNKAVMPTSVIDDHLLKKLGDRLSNLKNE